MLWFFTVFKKQVWYWLPFNVSNYVPFGFLRTECSVCEHVYNMLTLRRPFVMQILLIEMLVTILLFKVSR
jgi:hypothetical protein